MAESNDSGYNTELWTVSGTNTEWRDYEIVPEDQTEPYFFQYGHMENNTERWNVSETTTEWQENEITLEDQSEIMFRLISFMLLFFGVIGNIFSLIVWSRGSRCQKLQCSMYFKILALSDMLVMIICVSVVTSLPYLLKHFEENKTGSCQLLTALWFARELGPEISPWIIVTLSVERALSMMFPLKFTGQFAKRRALISFGFIMVVLILLQLIWVVSWQVDDSCFVIPEASLIMSGRWIYLKIFVLFAFPLFFIIICNTLIVFRFFRMRRMGLVTSGSGSQRNRRFATFTVLTLVTGILHFVSVTPTVIVYAALHCVLDDISQWCSSMEPDFNFWWHLSEIFLYLNNSFNFYFYCLAGRDFRDDLKDIICCRNRTATRNTIESPIEM